MTRFLFISSLFLLFVFSDILALRNQPILKRRAILINGIVAECKHIKTVKSNRMSCDSKTSPILFMHRSSKEPNIDRVLDTIIALVTVSIIIFSIQVFPTMIYAATAQEAINKLSGRNEIVPQQITWLVWWSFVYMAQYKFLRCLSKW